MDWAGRGAAGGHKQARAGAGVERNLSQDFEGGTMVVLERGFALEQREGPREAYWNK